ncbi:uncharacterized protein LTR77_003620 [Saxophila tyrrhenica]|uniref:Glycine zipper 2TM domain-containing protein n=1 Tax=Saxophila tyrrhenica TaxID=1690608 RepID=A0AAV9PE43_9PEZI|nr:hypothetical protein LTR77_003620 [Saxophila tyrrhenica]
MSRQSTIVDVTYNDPRTGQRVRERRVQEIPDDELDNVRQRERAMVLGPRRDRGPDYCGEADDNYVRSPPRRNEDYLAVDEYRPQRSRSYRGASSRRRSPSSSSASSSDSDYDRRRRHRSRHRRARSAKPARPESEDDDGILWYSGRSRKDGNFLERNFDSSYDGLFAAAAGAAIGAMTARRFAHTEGDEKNMKNVKTVGGLVAGAAAFNAAENRYRLFTEEKQERKREERVV